MQNKVKELSANAKAMTRGVMGLAFLIVVMGVVFGDVAFIWLFNNAFPTGIFRIAAYVGVFTTTLSVIGLFLGKSLWFRPGAQIICAWIFAFVEGVIVVVNTIAAFSVARQGGHIDPALGLWITYVSPATPIVAVFGWFLISWFSPDRAQTHARMEMQDKLAAAELEFELETGMAELEIKRTYLQAGKSFMHDEMNAPHIQGQVQQASANTMADVLSRVTGQYIVPRRIVSPLDQGNNNVTSFGQTDSLPLVVKPTNGNKKP